MNRGYLLIHRELWEKAWFQQLGAEQQLVLIYLMTRANWKETTLADGTVLKPGQIIMGRSEVSKVTGVSEKKIRRVLTVGKNVEFWAIERASHGTLITIVNWATYQDISNWFNEEGPDKGPRKGQTRAIQKEGKDLKKKKEPLVQPNGRTKKFSETDRKAADWIFARIQELKPDIKEPNLDAWANDIRLMVQRDKRTHREICELFKWANNDSFWKTNILCPATLRQQWDKLTIKRANPETRPNETKPAPFKPFDLKSIYE